MNAQDNPHDSLFKKTFSQPELVAQYLRAFFEPEIVKHLDLEHLSLEPTSYINDELKTFFSDIVYRVPYGRHKDKITISFLFEHKSTPPSHPHLQLLRYQLHIWENDTQQKLPLTPIVPIIIYHGKRKWHKKPFSEYFPGMDRYLRGFIPEFDYYLYNLKEIPDEILLGLGASFLVNAFLLLKHYGDKAYILNHMDRLFIHAEQLLTQYEGKSFIQVAIVYLLKTNELSYEEIKEIAEKVPKEIKSMTMSAYDTLINKGIKEGIERGIKQGIEQGIEQGLEKGIEKGIEQKQVEVIINAIRNGIDIATIAIITELSIKEVEKIIQEIVD